MAHMVPIYGRPASQAQGTGGLGFSYVGAEAERASASRQQVLPYRVSNLPKGSLNILRGTVRDESL